MKWGHAQNYHLCLDSGEIGITLNVYTHMEPDIVQLQFFSTPQYNLYPLSRTPDMVSFEEDSADDEPDPDLSQDVGMRAKKGGCATESIHSTLCSTKTKEKN